MNAVRKYGEEINSTEDGYAMRGFSERLARKPTVEAMEETLLDGAQHVSIFWPDWWYKQRRGHSVPSGREFVCDGNKGIVMSEENGTGATRLTKIKRAGATMKATAAVGDDLGLDISPKKNKHLQNSIVLHVSFNNFVGRPSNDVNVSGGFPQTLVERDALWFCCWCAGAHFRGGFCRSLIAAHCKNVTIDTLRCW